MKTNPDDMAFAIQDGSGAPGLSKREYFASLAMQGFCNAAYTDSWNENECAKHAVLMADALIAELNKAEGEK